jgi:hypothetical protein
MNDAMQGNNKTRNKREIVMKEFCRKYQGYLPDIKLAI